MKFREVLLTALLSQLPGDHGSGAYIPVVVGDCILGAPGEDVPCQYQPGQDSQRRHLCGSWRGGTERRVNKGRGLLEANSISIDHFVSRNVIE